MSKTIDKNINEPSKRYPKLQEAWNNLPARSLERRKILKALGLERSYVWRLLSKTTDDEPMRAAYLTVLQKELGVEEEVI